jgi:hypothetical protein
MAEIIRRVFDAYLAWDDPTSCPTPPQLLIRNTHSSPAEMTGLSGWVSCKGISRYVTCKECVVPACNNRGKMYDQYCFTDR